MGASGDATAMILAAGLESPPALDGISPETLCPLLGEPLIEQLLRRVRNAGAVRAS